MLKSFANRSLGKPVARRAEEGFTLLELVIVLTILAILLSISVPMYKAQIQHAKEAVLKQDLLLMRQQIDRYTVDREQAPGSLDDLVSAGYLREVPMDPITNSRDTWQTVADDDPVDIDKRGGIKDVYSGAEGVGGDGRNYREY